MKVVLAGICLQQEKKAFASQMEECRRLCEASNREVVDTVTQVSVSMHPKTAFRQGKLEELAKVVQESQAKQVVFYNDLSISMADRIQEVAGVSVIDRTALILEIFSLRARSKQALLQTELARLQYDLPRVVKESAQASEHARSSFNNRGSGEMRSALIERKYTRRISLLKEELRKIASKNGQDERRRGRTLLKKCALVGYTNAGKSSLMNAVLDSTHSAGSATFEQDMLFATLDTSVRRIDYASQSYYLYDTVGFVSKLPHTLVEAFQSTLSACTEADLLVIVLDASDPLHEEKLQVTLDTLKQIHAQGIETMIVYNKIDLVEDPSKFNGLCVSSKTMLNIDALQDRILEKMYGGKQITCTIPYTSMGMLDKYRAVLKVEVVEYKDQEMVVKLQGKQEFLQLFEKGENKNV